MHRHVLYVGSCLGLLPRMDTEISGMKTNRWRLFYKYKIMDTLDNIEIKVFVLAALKEH
jgi:hypothetical protein